MAGLLSPENLAKIVTVKDLVELAGMEDTVWNSFNTLLGNVPNLVVLTFIPVDALTNAMLLARIDDRPLTPVQSVQLGLVWRWARQSQGLEDVNPQEAVLEEKIVKDKTKGQETSATRRAETVTAQAVPRREPRRPRNEWPRKRWPCARRVKFCLSQNAFALAVCWIRVTTQRHRV